MLRYSYPFSYHFSGTCVCGPGGSACTSMVANKCVRQVLLQVCDLHFMHLNLTVFFTITVEFVSVEVRYQFSCSRLRIAEKQKVA